LETDYKWAVNASGDSQKIYGYWWPSGTLSWESVFYTNTSQEELEEMCNATLEYHNINRRIALVVAADNRLSLDHTIWNIIPYTAVKKGKFDRIISFGDSLSDTKNMFNASTWTLPNSHSWFLGRFSNGKVWVEYLSSYLKAPLYNWAHGGAAADSYLLIPGTLQQAQSWKKYIEHDRNYRPENTLFTVLIGGNDLVQYHRPVNEIIQAQRQTLKTLIESGATNILVLNLPDVSKAPIFKTRDDDGDISRQVGQYNEKIKQVVESLQEQYKHFVTIKLFDLHALFADFMARPAYYHFKNVSDSCLDTNSIEPFSFLTQAPLRSECVDLEDYIFWDALHPTTRAHQVLAISVHDFIKTAF